MRSRVREAAAWSGVETTSLVPNGPGVLAALAPDDATPLEWDDLDELGTV